MRPVLAILMLALSGCGACEKGGSAASGPSPYVRCMDVDPPAEREGTIGRVRFAVEERTLTLTAPSPLRIAAFRGAGASTGDLEGAMLGVKEHTPDVVFVLGELGETEESVVAHLNAFERLGSLVVVLASGADVAEALHDGVGEAETTRVFDGRALRFVRAGEDTFVLVSGAPQGRYAASDAHCGVSAEDLEALGDDAPDGRRWLVSWAAPAGDPVARGFDERDAGSREIAALARTLDAKGGLYAFPTTRALMPFGGAAAIAPGAPHARFRMSVARISGASDLLYDGAQLPPRAAHFELSSSGVAYIGTSVSSGH